MKVYVFLQLSLLHCILFDHSLENKMLKHFVLVLVAGCKILSAFWTLNILVMSTAPTTYPTRANTLVDVTHTNTHKHTQTNTHTQPTNKRTKQFKEQNGSPLHSRIAIFSVFMKNMWKIIFWGRNNEVFWWLVGTQLVLFVYN